MPGWFRLQPVHRYSRQQSVTCGKVASMRPVLLIFFLFSAACFAQDVQTAESCEQNLHGYWREKDARAAIVLFKDLKAAVQKDDRKAVANMVFYPLRVSGVYRVYNRTAFLQHYDQIFDKKVRE